MIALLVLLASLQEGPSVDFGHGDLKVSENRRFLVHADGTPFFWLGDTAWELFHRLTKDEAERYLENRRAKRFTVIQAVALAELDGLNTPNAEGHRPFADNDPAKPVAEYWAHVDWVVKKAGEKGLYIGLLPTWGDKITRMWGTGPEIFDAERARAYGKWIGARYKDAPNVIWINGGDRPPDKALEIWRALAAGVKEGDGSRHLMSFHPPGGRTSSSWYHADEWLDINMLQTGHSRNTDSGARIEADYRREPVKPVLDGEPTYEDHPLSFNPKNGYADDLDVRKYLYWDLFAGACGHTYGCHNIWQMMAPGRKPISWARKAWTESLDLPAAGQLRHARALMESRPYLSRVPDQSLIVSGERCRATRGDGYAFIYVPTGKSLTLALGRISGETLNTWWYDPREGTFLPDGAFGNSGTREFTPPAPAKDWILVLDDAMKKYALLGKRGTLPPPPPPARKFEFLRAFNLNGPPVTIDGHAWEGKDSPDLRFTGKAFENQQVPLIPPTDSERAKMIRSSVYDPMGSNATVGGLAPGTYQVFLTIWEDNDPATFDIYLEDVQVESGVTSGKAGEWKRLGPWTAAAKDGALRIRCGPGDANLSGIEIWRPAEKQ